MSGDTMSHILTLELGGTLQDTLNQFSKSRPRITVYPRSINIRTEFLKLV